MTEEKANASSLDDESIIELTDVVEEAEEEPVIELNEIVAEDAATGKSESAAAVELANGRAEDAAGPEEFSLMPDDMMDDLEADSQSRDLVQSLGMEIEPLADLPPVAEPPPAPEPTPVPAQPQATAAVSADPAQIDAAIERIIGPMVAERLDRILTEVIEKAVQREIERIKALLLEEGSRADG